MGNGECPKEGCPTFQMFSHDVKKDMEFLAEKMTDVVDKATTCLDNMTESHNALKETIGDFNTTLLRQGDRMEEGKRRFGNLENEIRGIKTKAEKDSKKITALETRKQMSKTGQTGLAAVAGGVMSAIVQFFQSQ